ncbi:MAG: alkaline phosphatase family protein [bacterium]
MKKKKLMVIGLDSAPPGLVFERFRGRLPNLNRLMEEGVYAELESCIPPITCPAWMCMVTGKDPGTLGIYGFRNRRDWSYDRLEFATSRMVEEETVWQILSRAGKKVVVLGVPETYPPKPLNGVLVSSFLAPDTSSDYTYPPELKDEIRDVVGEYIIDVRDFRTDDKERLLRELYEMTEKRFRLARHFARTKPWDFFMMVEMGPDRIHHGFWKHFDPTHPGYERGNPYEGAMADYYGFLDGKAGELIEDAGDAAVMVVSDHGAKRMEGGFCFNEWLIREGYLTLSKPPEGRARLEECGVDWRRTVAWGDGGYYGRLFLNVKGREPEGIVERKDYESVRMEIKDKLEALTDDQGKPMGTVAWKPEELYRAVKRIPPDLIVLFGGLNWRSVGTVGHGAVYTHENDTGPDDANHDYNGIFILRAPGVRKRGMMDRAKITDCASTMLKLMGMRPPADMQGKALV